MNAIDLAPVAYSVEQAALYTGLSTSLLNQLRCKGGGPAFVKAGRRVSYRRCDLDAWLASRVRRSTSEAAA